MAKMGILIDTTKCIGCDACEKACKMRNGLPLDLENNLSMFRIFDLFSSVC